jgi:cyclophilin family peptidyl-prolyl cis-trans isomerase
MRKLPLQLWDLLIGRRQPGKRGKKPATKSRWRPVFETLEDRVTPATAGFARTAPGVLTGVVYQNSANAAAFTPGDPVIPGADVTLTGTTTQGTPVSVSTTTDANGKFTFFQVMPGTYSLIESGTNDFIGGGQTTPGSLGGTPGNNAISFISVAEGQAGISYNLPVRGLAPKFVSLRQFLATTPHRIDASFLPSAAGSGIAAADNSAQPSGTATSGTSALAGSILDSGGHGIAGVQVTLTGTDHTGRDVVPTTTTAADGSYQFANLQPGTYTINVAGQASGLIAGSPTVGSQGGVVVRNDQVLDIGLASGASGTRYNFTESRLAAPAVATSPQINATLADDTAGPGGTTSDRITSDPSIEGNVFAGKSPVVRFQAGFDATPAVGFTDILADLGSDGSFFLNPAQLAQIAGGNLADGSHTLHLTAANAQGQSTSTDLSFTLMTAPPSVPTLHMDTTSDPNQTGRTTSTTVTLLGQTSPGAQVTLTQGTNAPRTATANSTGAFTFSNVTLTAGSATTSGTNTFVVQATDKAGNTSQFSTFFVVNNGPVAVPTSPVAETLSGTTEHFVDLSDPTIFKDPDMGDSLISFNTSVGVINAELLDAQAPQTVANFLSYIAQGSYTNDIFHRLVTDFVLQGGGFTFDPNAKTITDVTAGPMVPNEFDATNRPNILGTIAMAKTSDPNSATSQFFFNNANNTSLDQTSNSGGFTVFGRLVSGADQRVVNTLAAYSIKDESSFNGALNTIPLKNYTGTNFPSDTTTANYALINSVTVLRQPERLTYSIVTNSNPALVTATIKQGQLDLQPIGTATGTATIVVQATDLAGKTASVTFTVTR